MTYLSTLFDSNAAVPSLSTKVAVSIGRMYALIREIGAAHIVLTSDLGQSGNPVPTDGFRQFIEDLMDEGISKEEINRMIKINPCRLLGIAE